MRKKITFLLFSLLISIGAMADYEYYPDNDCWVDENGVIYKVVDDIMYLYSYNKPATGDYGEATVPGAPEWDSSKDYDLEVLDYFEEEGYTVTQIYSRAFMGVTNIKTLKIPATIEKIGATAFSGCTGLETITCYATTPPDITAGSCFGMASSGSNAYKATVYVPYGCKDAYLNDGADNSNKGWGYYAAQSYFTYEELAEGDTGTVTQGILTVSPETNSRLKGQLESITISYDGGVALNAESLSIDILDSDGAVAAILKPAASANSDGSYTLYVYDATGATQTPLTTYGDYTLTIPKSSFTLGEDKSTVNVKTTLNYTVEDDNQYTISLSPENGSTSSTTLSSFSVSCADGITQLIGGLDLSSNYVNVYKDGSSTAFTHVTKNGDDDSDTETTINFIFDTSISTPGTYRFTFPEASFIVGPYNQLSEALDVTYIIGDDVVEDEGEWAIFPSDSTAIRSLSVIQLQYSTGLEIAAGKENQITITDTEGNSYGYSISEVYNGVEFILDEEILQSGEYTLYAPKGTLLLGQTKQECDDFSVTFTVASYNLTFNPANGSKLDEISGFTVTCEDGLEPVLTEDKKMDVLGVTQTIEGVSTLIATAVPDESNPIIDSEGTTIGYTFTFKDIDTENSQTVTFTSDGTYQIAFGVNYFLLGPEKIANQATTLVYYIGDDALTEAYNNLKADIDDLKEKLSTTWDAIQDVYVSEVITAEYNAITGEISALETALDEAYDDGAGTVDAVDFSNQISQISSEITEMQTESQSWYNFYSDITADDDELSTSLESTWKEIGDKYPETVADLQATYDKIVGDIATLKTQVASSYENKTLEADSDGFDTTIASIEKDIENLLSSAIASGINGVTVSRFEGKTIYTISGQKVASPAKAGIYIIDGKKVVIK